MTSPKKPTFEDWARFVRTHMPPPGTPCMIIGVRATNAFLKVTKGPFKGHLFHAELVYNDMCYKALPKYSA